MGLKSSEIPNLKLQFGNNEIVPNRNKSFIQDVIKILSDPMGIMLLILSFIYWMMGENKEALILLISYIPVTLVDVVLEFKSTKALKALGQSLEQKVKVLRDNQITEISTIDLLPGDDLLFEEGQKISADGIFIEANQVLVNEAALTGESLPIEKSIGEKFYAGTILLSGNGIGRVENIGLKTKFGKISELLSSTENELSPLKKKINILVKYIFILAIVLGLFIFLYQYYLNKNILNSLIEALTFAMAAIPEEFPLVFTLYLSLGAYRLSKHGVLVKSLPSVESLGSVDVLCTDKTGTLTEGIFELNDIIMFNSNISMDDCWKFSRLACEKIPLDLMEIEIEKKCDYLIPPTMTLIHDYPFEITGKHMSHVWHDSSNNRALISMKGSIEGVLEHCLVDNELKSLIEIKVKSLAGAGYRLLGLAIRHGDFSGNRLTDEKDLTFVGILCFRDPIRKNVKNAIELCQESGIEIKMITGDHPLTAHAIADELNIIHDHKFIFTGKELEALSREDKKKAYLNGAIFSRVTPDQKYELIKTLKDSNKTVAMTGDGINDSPALKIADIGISMGKNATDVARQSAQMVLLENNFNGIVEAVIEGRKIFTNLKKSFSYLISFHVPILFFTFIPIILGFGAVLNPIHIVLLELIVHPISAFTFENLATGNQLSKNFMSYRIFFKSAFLSIGYCLLIWFWYLRLINNESLQVSKSILISSIMVANISFVFNECFPRLTLRLLLTSAALVGLTIMLSQFAFISNIFNLQTFSMSHYVIILLFNLIIIFLNIVLNKVFNFK